MDVRQFLYEREKRQGGASYPASSTTSKKRNLHKFTVDGNTISGYYTYSFFYQKTYPKEPTRSQGGVIDNLNSYATFNTPTLKIKFNALSLDQYRVIMQLILSKNEFVVTCYDEIYDRDVTVKMYFAPDDYPELFSMDLELLAVLNYEIELIGTNADLSTASIVYNKVKSSDSTQPQVANQTLSRTDLPVGAETLIGEGVSSLKTLSGWTFDHWEDKNGVTYVDGEPYILPYGGLTLYAMWKKGGTYKLSYDYGVGEIGTNSNSQPVTSSDIALNGTITLISTQPKKVTWNKAEYTPYNTTSYWTWQTGNGGNQVKTGDKYTIQGNSTVYQHFTPNTYSVTYLVDSTEYSKITGAYGATFVKPADPKKDGKTFVEWRIGSTTGTAFDQTTIPPTNVTLYAVFR